jgi:hypothetical protein
MTTSKPGGVAGVIHQIEKRTEELSAHASDAQKLFAGWGAAARRITRNNPGTVLIGALALGFVLARAARHA